MQSLFEVRDSLIELFLTRKCSGAVAEARCVGGIKAEASGKILNRFVVFFSSKPDKTAVVHSVRAIGVETESCVKILECLVILFLGKPDETAIAKAQAYLGSRRMASSKSLSAFSYSSLVNLAKPRVNLAKPRLLKAMDT